ncbi:hypothetical protein BKA58DRAFT_33745 [Alternaria rosae]|uniref:uncharacterized protein n=1 Tax=Alternaria rosae TaxID=1187941 RepID=UPI001E8EE5E6|nr:uncharacterized protein BKA58DRAFT_33745 [Alternaria rosae]KAH6883262.1 hypothetical protein BKA58DRAFT_33745 [Alternaria rosae]
MPALLMRIEGWPRPLRMLSAVYAITVGLETSQRKYVSNSFDANASGASYTSSTATRMPCEVRASTMALSIPLHPPVTITISEGQFQPWLARICQLFVAYKFRAALFFLTTPMVGRNPGTQSKLHSSTTCERDVASKAFMHVCSGMYSTKPSRGPVMIGSKAHLAMMGSPLRRRSMKIDMNCFRSSVIRGRRLPEQRHVQPF